jgi:glyoxylase-like metal-dependent hydrolase (beta-lactamase superfamily II)
MTASLARYTAALSDDVVVYPGHGPSTTIGREKKSNPFLTGAARLVRR